MSSVRLWLIRLLGGNSGEFPPHFKESPSSKLVQDYIDFLRAELEKETTRAEELQKLLFEKCGLCTEKVISTPQTTQEPLKTSRESWPRMKRHFEERDAREAYWRAKGGVPTDKVKEDENAGKIS